MGIIIFSLYFYFVFIIFRHCLTTDDNYVTRIDIQKQKLDWNQHLAHMNKLGVNTERNKESSWM